MFPKWCEIGDLWAKNTIDPTMYLLKYGHPCNTIITNPFGSSSFNDTEKDNDGEVSLKKHEGIDFSSFRLLV